MPKTVPVLAATTSPTNCDRLGELLTKKLASDAEPWRAELTALLDLFKTHYKDHAADLPIRAEGNQYFIDFTKREIKRTITNPQRAFDALKKAMGIAKLVQAITITFKLLDTHVAVAEQGSYVSQARTGSRDVTAVLKPKAA